MTQDAFKDYLHDLGWEIRGIAARTNGDEPFDDGVRMGLYEVVTLMQSQAETFGLDLAPVGLDGFDPEAELLRRA